MSLQISIVSQEPTLFNCSIEENIAYGFDGKVDAVDLENASVIFSKSSFCNKTLLSLVSFAHYWYEFECRKWPMHMNLYQNSQKNTRPLLESVG